MLFSVNSPFGVTHPYILLLLYFFKQVKMLMVYNVKTTNLTFVGKKMRCIVNNSSVT